MRWPWVSAARLDDAKEQIADLKKANFMLLELLGMKQVAAVVGEQEQPAEPPRQARKLGAELRAEFRVAAEERARQMGPVKK